MIIIRVDGNKQIGTGHIMRCLSIADAFRKIKEDICFVIADDTMKGLIESRGYRTFTLFSQYHSMESELPVLKQLLDHTDPKLVLVDSYFATEAYFRALKSRVRTVYIDDYKYKPYSVDALINYNIYSDQSKYEKLYSEAGAACPDLITGLKYAPLREQFKDLPKHITAEKVATVLFSTGGTDPFHLSRKLIERLGKNGDNFRQYIFLIGSMNEEFEEIKKLAGNTTNCILKYNISDMRTLISGCDIVVSAAGSTLYEVTACGVPLITYAFADNQMQGTKAFESKELAISCGNITDVHDPAELIINKLQLLAENYQMRKDISIRMQELVDGYGADRIAERLSCWPCS